MGLFNTTLILGGARSGKTAHALRLCEAAQQEYGLDPYYIATAQAFDDEMTDRINRHRLERGSAWTTVEAPLALAEAICNASTSDRVLLVDCLTLWLTNHLLSDPSGTASEAVILKETEALLDAFRDASGPVIVVSNEVGFGIVPENKLARRFRDEAGRLNQRVAEVASRVELVAAGLPLILKGA